MSRVERFRLSYEDYKLHVERSNLQQVLRKIDAIGIIKRTRCPLFQIMYEPVTYRVATEAEAFDASLHDPAKWRTIRFELRAMVLGRDRYVCIMCNGLVVCDPWRWTSYDELPEVI
jgi:hypothetical protein